MFSTNPLLRWAIAFVTLIMLTPAQAAPQQGVTGQVISKTELAPPNGLQEAAEQYLIHYRSTSGVDGVSSREDTAAVFLPKGTAPQDGWPVVIWTHGTIGVARGCAPSLNPRTPRDAQYLNTWLSLGFAVVAPDYAGLGSAGLHHYMNARAEAWSVLDSARAALGAFPLRNQLVLVGQSQGAHAAFSSAGYQPQYAPALNIRATVLTGTPYFAPGLSAAQIFAGGTQEQSGDPKIPYAFYLYLSAADQQPGLNASDYFQPRALPVLEQARQLCITPLTAEVMQQGLNAGNSLKPAIQQLLDEQTDALRYATLKIAHPVFIGIGGEDINVPTAMQQRFATAVREAGTAVDVHQYPGLDHSSAMNPSLRDSVPFVLRTLAEER
ncbi:dienelactone hydrolase family protein [Enterobacillus tribolii]|uniref:Dienelactone hydrolase family protein n=2 Tax=Enterobacillus tribolii TaxID=1487935 RepID=A0A370QHC6_9GAMM|nr:dienelactone hydrolase family protein [Enterobacillus tribolii]